MNYFRAILFILLVAAQSAALSATRTVCSSGCNGTTIQGVYNGSSCGDIIEVRSNSDYAEQLDLGKNCSAGATLTIKSGDGFNPRVNPNNATADGNAITISGNYHIIDNIDLYDHPVSNGIFIAGDHNIYRNSYIDQISTNNFPTGDNYESVHIDGNYNTLDNNYIGPGDHGAVWVGPAPPAPHATHNRITNNIISSPYGHCIEIAWSEYNLIEGNFLKDCGVSCTGGSSCDGKNVLQILDTAHNTFRNNVAYNFRARAFEINEYHGNSTIENNWFYNNTFYNTPASNASAPFMAIGISAGLTGNITRNNKFYNNIVDPTSKLPNPNINDWYVGVLFWYLGGSPNCGNNVSELIASDFCGNTLKNNIIRPYNSGAYRPSEPSAIAYVGGPCSSGLCLRWTVSQINTMGASHSGNVTSDPMLVSTNTATQNWWHLSPGSPAIDAGVVVNDPNAAVGGWPQLTYSGAAPDIGAHEYASGTTTYTVTPSAGSNGTISPNTPQTVNSGSTTAFTVTPNSGYTASVGGTCGGSLVGTTYTTNAITANCTVSATFADSQAPTAPTGLNADSASNTSLTLDWNASTDNVGVTGYQIDACAGYNCTNYAQIGVSATNSYTHSGLTAAPQPTIYRYRVRAVDAASNPSVNSTTIHYNARPTIPAFPGAEGAGATAMGGRGGTICRVTNLNDSGTGSFRACVLLAGPRTVVFDTGGTIELLSQLTVSNPYLTIAGHTAPGGGIQISGKQLTGTNDLFIVDANDIVIRHVRFRAGNSTVTSQYGDTLKVLGHGNRVILDHLSVFWTKDENMGLSSGPTKQLRNVTTSWSIFAEPLNAHPMNFFSGGSTRESADNMRNLDTHHSLFANTSERNPAMLVKSYRHINNITYNWRNDALQLGGGIVADVIGNLFKRGPLYPGGESTSAKWEVRVFPSGNANSPNGDPSIYIDGNIGNSAPTLPSDDWAMCGRMNGLTTAVTGPLETIYRRFSEQTALTYPITTSLATNLETVVLPTVGASKKLGCDGALSDNRDSTDARVISEYGANQGIVPTTEADVGGFPSLVAGTACTDTDGDGMPNVWETANGLNPSSSADGNGVHASGYTNLEMYLSGLTYTVTGTAGANGSISPISQVVNNGATAILTVTPNIGYTASVDGTCGGSLVGNTYTTNAITANCTVSAAFCKKLSIPSSLAMVGLVANPPNNIMISFDWGDITTHTDGSALTGDLANYRLYWSTVQGGPYSTASSVFSSISVGPTQPDIMYYARVAAESSIASACNSYQSSEISFLATDSVPPVTTINTSDPSKIMVNSLIVAGSSSDNIGVTGCKWRIGSAPNAINGTACSGTTSFSCNTSTYTFGANTLYVGCYDAAGNYGSDSIAVNYIRFLSAPTNLRIFAQ